MSARLDDGTLEALRQKLDTLNANYAKAIEQGDGELLAEVFCVDGGIIDNDFGNTFGSDQLRRLAVATQLRETAFTITTRWAKPEDATWIWAAGDWSYRAIQEGHDGREVRSNGAFVQLWHVDDGGQFRIHRDVTLRGAVLPGNHKNSRRDTPTGDPG